MTAGFGLEKLGLAALRFPRLTLLLLLGLTPLFLFAASRLDYSSDIREIFRSGTPEFAQLEEVQQQFPGSERDILLVVEGTELFQRATLEKLRTLHLDLSLTPGVRDVLSIFSARHPPDARGNAAALFPVELAEIEDLDVLKRQVLAHPLIADKLISKDGRLMLVVLGLDGRQRNLTVLRSLVAEIDGLAQETLDATGVRFSLTGIAVMRLEIIAALIRDQLLFAGAGLIIGLALCWLFFRRLAYVLIAGAPAVIANLWFLGGLHLLGQQINILTNVVPVLVMVIVFSDALHLLFGVRRELEAGSNLRDAIAGAVREVGPACVLTSVTTTIALLSLTLVPHPFIGRFGLTAAAGTALAYAVTMSTVPALARLLLGPGRASAAGDRRRGRTIDVICAAAARLVAARPGATALTGVFLTVLAAALYAQNEPRYRYLENLPEDNPAFRAIKSIDRKLAGPNTLRLYIQWPRNYELAGPDTLDLIREAHQVLASEPALKSVWSLYSVEQWMAGGGLERENLFAFLEKARSPLSTRILAPEHNAALITANFPDLDTSVLTPALDGLEQRFDFVRQKHPDVRFILTGLVPLSARTSYTMIGQLNRSLLIAVGVIIVLIALALRSAAAGLMSILPNLLPLAVGGASLYLFDRGLQFTSVVAFTIGFGIAVDSTIHVLNRYRLGREAGQPPPEALSATITIIGPVLIVSTVVLACGVGATVLSELPMVRLYGQVSIIVLVTALIGDLLFLPAIVHIVDTRRRQRRRLSEPDEGARSDRQNDVQI
ncbi:MAG: efflux RND transporter permease subunit [Methyloligellaceae bacterium]